MFIPFNLPFRLFFLMYNGLLSLLGSRGKKSDSPVYPKDTKFFSFRKHTNPQKTNMHYTFSS